MNNKLNFLSIPEKLDLLKQANDKLNISQSDLNKIIFIYSKPKVGSTSLVTSLRVFVSHLYIILHIHDEDMLRVLSNINGITVNELILYNHFIGKEVYVIDVFRSPVERKISAFFEKIDCFHFNNHCSEINKYDINKLFNRFDKLFPHLGNGDHFIDNYNIELPHEFDYENKYLCIDEKGIKYIKLRLKDSDCWGEILTKIFKQPIRVIKDYETENKTIKDAYLNFKQNYRIPVNFLKDLNNCYYLNYYYSEAEIKEYLDVWRKKSKEKCNPFTAEEYKVYESISKENNHLDVIQSKHYLDEGCLCIGCKTKRSELAKKLLEGDTSNIARIIHEEVKTDILVNRVNVVNNINNKIRFIRSNRVNRNARGGLWKIVPR